MEPDNTLPRWAVRGVLSSQWAYWVSLSTAALATIYIPPGSVRTLVLLTPVLTALFCISVAYWLYQACDEYLRARLLRCVTATALIVAACTLVYFFLELSGWPRISMIWINILGWSVFNAQMLFVILRSR